MDNMEILWTELKFAHGKASHGQSQENVLNGIQDIKNIFTTWMQGNQYIS